MQFLSRRVLLPFSVLMCAVPLLAPAQQLPSAPQQNPLPPPAPQVPSTTPTGPSTPLNIAPNRPASYVAPKWKATIDPGQAVVHYTAADKLRFAMREQISPVVFIPASFSAGWESLIDGNPKYGSDSAGFGERFGAAMLRGASGRILGDGVFAMIFRQDPRYYRVEHGSIKHRLLGSVEQTFVRRNDEQVNQFNWSGTFGHAFTSALLLTYYPQTSANGRVAVQSFATSFAGDATGKLFREFVPDLFGYLQRRRHKE